MTKKLVICTPTYGQPHAAMVSWGYHNACCRLMQDARVAKLEATLFVNCDLVRARSRAVRMFLETDATHLLFWDDDVIPRDMVVLGAMLDSGKDVVALPYPRKQLHWDRVADAIRDEQEQTEMGRQAPEEIEGAGLDWPLRSIDSKLVDGFTRASSVGLGFTVISRSCLERMVSHYGPSLTFLDRTEGAGQPTVALFQLMITSDGDLLSEDYAFCRRWLDIGGDVWVFADPARHVGTHVFGSTLGTDPALNSGAGAGPR